MTAGQTVTAAAFPVSLVMVRRYVQHGRLRLPQWELLGIVAGEGVAQGSRERRLVRSEEGSDQYVWSGFVVHRYKDGAESYWHNLKGKTPSLFVVCREDGDELVPFLVTASQDDAAGHEEADNRVFAAAMPPEIYQWLEGFVLAHYVPQAKHKRKRKNWVEESIRGNRPR